MNDTSEIATLPKAHVITLSHAAGQTLFEYMRIGGGIGALVGLASSVVAHRTKKAISHKRHKKHK